MKHLKKFNTETQYNSFKNSSEYVEPNVSFVKNTPEVKFTRRDPILKFTAVQANSTIKLNRVGTATTLANAVLQYSTNNGETCNDYTLGNTITLDNVVNSVKFKGTNATLGTNSSNYHKFVMTGKIKASGDITSLFNEVGGDFAMPSYGCTCMFIGCASLIAAPELPATTLAQYCYQNMFNGTSLTTAPELPAMTLASTCYMNMFYGCTLLTTAPKLPAMTLAKHCYNGMFCGCTSLTTAPKLPATTLAQYCYSYMFQNCISLTAAPKLPATTLTINCYSSMFQGCTSLTMAPELPAMTLANNCYSNMFYGCTSLITAPELPATTLITSCYFYMFYGCSNLNYIKALFKTTPSTTYTNSWVKGVSSTGTFVKNSEAQWDVIDIYGVPTGWTVQTVAA